MNESYSALMDQILRSVASASSMSYAEFTDGLPKETRSLEDAAYRSLSEDFRSFLVDNTRAIAAAFFLPPWLLVPRSLSGRAKAEYMVKAARVPATLLPQTFGPWTIERRTWKETILGMFDPDTDRTRHWHFSGGETYGHVGWPDFTLLRRPSLQTIHQSEIGEVVMEDSMRELRRHLPIFLAARGRILITGLGLGCVVRGLLSNPDVTHIDVVEIDAGIIAAIGPEFAGNDRVAIHHADALEVVWHPDARWDFAWHDIWSEDGDAKLVALHGKLLVRYHKLVGRQGAWQLPRILRRLHPGLLGAPKVRTKKKGNAKP